MKDNQLIKNFLIMFVAYVVDSTIAYFLPYNLTKAGITIVPCLGLMLFSLLSMTLHDRSERFFFSAVCGLYYCICYSNSLLIYVLFYCMITFVRSYLYRNDNMNVLEFFVFAFLVVLLKEVSVYWLMRFTHITQLGLLKFGLLRLLPTLGFNGVFSFLVYFIYTKFNFTIEPNNFENTEYL